MLSTVFERLLRMPRRKYFPVMNGNFLFLRQTLNFAKMAKFTVGAYIILGVLSGLTETLGIALLVPLVDSISGEQRLFAGVPLLQSLTELLDHVPAQSRIFVALSTLVALVVMRGILALIVDVLSYSIPLRIEKGLRAEALDGLALAETAFSETITVDRAGTLCISIPARIGISIRFACMMIVSALLALVMITLIILISPVVSAIAFAGVLCIVVAYRELSKREINETSNRLTGLTEKNNRTFFETIYSLADARIYGVRGYFLGRTEALTAQLMGVQYKNLFFELMSYPIVSTVSGLALAGGLLTINILHPDKLPDLVAPMAILIALVLRLIGPLTTINICRHHFGIHSVVYDEFDEFMRHLVIARERSGDIPPRPVKGELAFNKVSFSYVDRGVLTMNEVSLRINPGEIIMIVGPSGGGKTTLAKLAANLYWPSSGSISIDGQDLRSLKRDQLRRHISLINQDSYVADCTVSVAIAMSDNYDAARVKKAADMAQASEFISELPQKWDSVLTNDAASLSSGQRQRLLIARALYHDPSLLILDETLNFQDAKNKREILERLMTLRGSLTTLIITHDLETAMLGDRVMVVASGVIKAFDTPGQIGSVQKLSELLDG